MSSENDSLALQDFLNSLNAKNTLKLYKKGIEMFCEFYNKSFDEILEERKQDLIPKPDEDLVTAKQRADRFEKDLEKFYLALIEKTENREAYAPAYVFLQVLTLFFHTCLFQLLKCCDSLDILAD